MAGTVLLWIGMGDSQAYPPQPPAQLLLLHLSPAKGLPGTEVRASGTCPAPSEATTSPPSSSSATPPDVVLSIDDIEVGTAHPSASGSFTTRFTVPDDVSPGSQWVTTDPLCGAAPFEVLEPGTPSLSLHPVGSTVPADVSASGTCPTARKGVVISLNSAELATVSPDTTTGAFGPIPLHLSGDLSPGGYEITTSCGASATFTVLTSRTTPTTTPPTTTPPTSSSTSTSTPSLVEVPNIVGKTQADALRALGDRLYLANGSGAGEHITSQHPPAGSLVPAGSAVTVAWETSPPNSEGGLPPWLLLVGLPASAAAVVVAWQFERARRGRRWCERHVGTAASTSSASVQTEPTGVHVPAQRVRLEAHPDAGQHSGGGE